jgi:hypothetical protein
LIRLSGDSAEILTREAKATNKKPEEIVNKLIMERLAKVSAVI